MQLQNLLITFGYSHLMMIQRRFPKYPIPSVGAVIVGPKGVLLIKRDKPPFMGLWNIPTGVVGLGETQEEAVLREVKEETGVTGEVIRFLETSDVIISDENNQVEFHYVVNVYLFQALPEETESNAKASGIGWFHPSSLPLKGMVDGVYRALHAMESHLLQIMQSY